MKKSTAQATRGKSIHGPSTTEKLSAEILPILIRQAKAHNTITYGALAKEIGTHHRVIGAALGIIGNELSKMEEAPPPINVCVVRKNTGEPSQGVDEFMEQRLLKIQKAERSVAIRLLQEESFNYSGWDEILKKLSLKPSVGTLQETSPDKYHGGSGESKAHKDFKEFVKQHPEKLYLHKEMTSLVEYELKSGDRLDVVFENDQEIVGVEVKSRISDVADIQRGLFQVIKYHAVLTAMESVSIHPRKVKTCLVLENAVPRDLVWVQNTLDVEVFELFRGTQK